MALQIDQNSDINYLVPLSPVDGNLIAINKQNGIVNLLFYQTRKQTGEHLDKVDIIGAVFYTNTADLKSLYNSIGDALEHHEKDEK